MKKAQKIGETLPRLLKSLGTCHLQAWHRISLYSGLMIGLVLLLIGCTGIIGPKNPVLVKLTIHYVNESADTVLMHIRGEFATEKKLAPGASRKEIVDIELWDQTDGTKTVRVLRTNGWVFVKPFADCLTGDIFCVFIFPEGVSPLYTKVIPIFIGKQEEDLQFSEGQNIKKRLCQLDQVNPGSDAYLISSWGYYI